MRAPVRLSDLHTRAEAVQYLKQACLDQLQESIMQKTPPNEEITGDLRVRQAFRLVLSPAEQRAFFHAIVRDQRYWPRIKSLFGSPPFSFLLPEDEGLLRAGGICRNRAHLAAIDSSVSKASDFGAGHFYDHFERLYRVVANPASKTAVPWRGISEQTKIVMDVRLKQYTHKAKMDILRGEARTEQVALMFPRPGEKVRLHLSSVLEEAPRQSSSDSTSGAKNEEDGTSLLVQVVSGFQKAKQSPVARLVMLVLRRG